MTSKKIAFKLLLFFGVSAFALQGIISCTPAKKEKFIGLQFYSVRDDMNKDTKTTVAKVGEMGYKFIEAAGFNEGKFYGMEPLAFKELCETNGLQFLGSHTGQDVPDSVGWEKIMAWWDACIDAHAAAGVKWIVQPWMGNTAYESLEGLKRYCEYFNAVGEKCNAKGIRFGYHNHDKEFSTVFEGQPIYDWMLQSLDADKVTMEIDLYWCVEGGKNPVDYFNQYPGRFELWHIKDKEEVGASGNMDFESIFAAKDKSGFKYGIVEVEEYNFEPLVSCEKSIAWLKEQNFVKM
jgi:sugar phosphate isomerase/epimerase